MKKHSLRWGIRACASLLLALGAAGASAQILIGQTSDLTGPSAAPVKETIEGAELVIDAVNARGGVNGEPIQVIRMDNAFDIERAGENARLLIEEKKVVALFMSRGTPNTQAIIPWLDKYEVALIGPSTGAMVLHKPLQKHVFNVRATYQSEAEKAARHLLTIGLTRVAVVHAADSFGKDALQGAMKGFDEFRARPVVVVPADREKPDYAAVVSKIRGANAQAVLWFGASRAVAEGVKALRAAGSAAQVVTLSNNASGGFIKELGDVGNGVIVTQVFPNERQVGLPLINEASTLAKAGGRVLSPAMLEGFAAAKVLVEALRRAGPKPTRARVIAALEGMHHYDLGGLELSYSPQDHSGIDFAELSIISNGKFKR
jgi:ABC-type branched-subunit amino acid transport system substrate-binding protein